jgi:hypothetical protein
VIEMSGDLSEQLAKPPSQGKPYIVQMVHELNQFALRKLLKRMYVFLVMKEFIESVNKCLVQVVETLEGHDWRIAWRCPGLGGAEHTERKS